ncbi:UNKNOWN [Stylonychia lemnae]|uniref:TLDc domain-containing protein n=1 Tax=Stylonychia lemnae TaxID=5949 RepID=A0A078AAW6_STYLE|nr:UNKNOWN [Stylonychia lemnae]|eukprot:CDW79395.1 UNKNOWN [Stylonychia lemnae]
MPQLMIIKALVQLLKGVILRVILLEKYKIGIQPQQLQNSNQILGAERSKPDQAAVVVKKRIIKEEEKKVQMNKFDNPKTQISFNQIYMGSRDGFKAKDFHSRCDNKGPTVCFILSDSGNVFGGFVTKSWKSQYSWEGDINAFIFSLTHRTIHPYYNQNNTAIKNDPNQSWNQGYGDISIKDRCNEVNSNTSWLGWSYALPHGFSFTETQSKTYLGGMINFKVLDIEVFQVLKKIS